MPVCHALPLSLRYTCAAPHRFSTSQAAFPDGAWANVDMKADPAAGPKLALAALDAAAAVGGKVRGSSWGDAHTGMHRSGCGLLV